MNTNQKKELDFILHYVEEKYPGFSLPDEYTPEEFHDLSLFNSNPVDWTIYHLPECLIQGSIDVMGLQNHYKFFKKLEPEDQVLLVNWAKGFTYAQIAESLEIRDFEVIKKIEEIRLSSNIELSENQLRKSYSDLVVLLDNFIEAWRIGSDAYDLMQEQKKNAWFKKWLPIIAFSGLAMIYIFVWPLIHQPSGIEISDPVLGQLMKDLLQYNPPDESVSVVANFLDEGLDQQAIEAIELLPEIKLKSYPELIFIEVFLLLRREEWPAARSKMIDLRSTYPEEYSNYCKGILWRIRFLK